MANKYYKIISWLFVIIFAPWPCNSYADATAQPDVFVSAEQIKYLQDNPAKLKELKFRCDSDLKHAPSPIEDFTPPLHYYDKKGEAVYGEAVYFDALLSDGNTAYHEALCYRVFADKQYAQKAEDIIDAWTKTVKNIPLKGQGAYDFAFAFYLYTIAADLLRTDTSWDNKDFVSLLKTKVLPACESTGQIKNNIANWTVLQWATAGTYLNDSALIERAHTRWDELLNSQVSADGSMPLETCRTNSVQACDGPDKGINGINYTHWALYPLVIAAEVFHNRGVDVYSTPAGHKLEAAYAHAAGWTFDPTTFPYYKSNNGKLNGVRNAAYFAVLQLRIPNTVAAEVLKQGKVGMNPLELLLLYVRD